MCFATRPPRVAGQSLTHPHTCFQLADLTSTGTLAASGTVKQTLPFEEELGSPTLLNINGSYLAVCTDAGQLKVFKIGGREARPFAGPSSLLPQDDAAPLQQADQKKGRTATSAVASIRVNCTGQMVSGVLTKEDGEPDGRIAVFSSESNVVYTYDFGAEQQIPLVSALGCPYTVNYI